MSFMHNKFNKSPPLLPNSKIIMAFNAIHCYSLRQYHSIMTLEVLKIVRLMLFKKIVSYKFGIINCLIIIWFCILHRRYVHKSIFHFLTETYLLKSILQLFKNSKLDSISLLLILRIFLFFDLYSNFCSLVLILL